MTAPARPPRPRSTGGRPLMLLGVLLALAAGTIVIFIVSQATSTGPSLTTVVESAIKLPSNSILVAQLPATQDPTQKYILISQAFVTKQVPVDAAPADAFPWKSQDDLNAQLTNKVVVGDFLQGEILRKPDERLADVGTGGPGSLTNINPGKLGNGQVLMTMELTTATGAAGKPIAVPGDHIDILVAACQLPGKGGTCISQTTLQDLLVYTVQGSTVMVVVNREQALQLLEIKQIASEAQVVVRRPGDDTIVTTTSIDPNTIVNLFHF